MNIEAFNDNSEIGAPFIMEGFEDCEGKTGSDCSAMTCNWNDTQGKCENKDGSMAGNDGSMLMVI